MASSTHPELVEGYLSKQGKTLGQWKSRFFMLSQDFLFWYKDQKTAQNGGTPWGHVLLEGAVINPLSEQQYGAFCFGVGSIRDDRIRVLRASSENERERWIASLRHNVRPLSITPKRSNMSEAQLAKQASSKALLQRVGSGSLSGAGGGTPPPSAASTYVPASGRPGALTLAEYVDQPSPMSASATATKRRSLSSQQNAFDAPGSVVGVSSSALSPYNALNDSIVMESPSGHHHHHHRPRAVSRDAMERAPSPAQRALSSPHRSTSRGDRDAAAAAAAAAAVGLAPAQPEKHHHHHHHRHGHHHKAKTMSRAAAEELQVRQAIVLSEKEGQVGTPKSAEASISQQQALLEYFEHKQRSASVSDRPEAYSPSPVSPQRRHVHTPGHGNGDGAHHHHPHGHGHHPHANHSHHHHQRATSHHQLARPNDGAGPEGQHREGHPRPASTRRNEMLNNMFNAMLAKEAMATELSEKKRTTSIPDVHTHPPQPHSAEREKKRTMSSSSSSETPAEHSVLDSIARIPVFTPLIPLGEPSSSVAATGLGSVDTPAPLRVGTRPPPTTTPAALPSTPPAQHEHKPLSAFLAEILATPSPRAGARPAGARADADVSPPRAGGGIGAGAGTGAGFAKPKPASSARPSTSPRAPFATFATDVAPAPAPSPSPTLSRPVPQPLSAPGAVGIDPFDPFAVASARVPSLQLLPFTSLATDPPSFPSATPVPVPAPAAAAAAAGAPFAPHTTHAALESALLGEFAFGAPTRPKALSITSAGGTGTPQPFSYTATATATAPRPASPVNVNRPTVMQQVAHQLHLHPHPHPQSQLPQPPSPTQMLAHTSSRPPSTARRTNEFNSLAEMNEVLDDFYAGPFTQPSAFPAKPAPPSDYLPHWTPTQPQPQPQSQSTLAPSQPHSHGHAWSPRSEGELEPGAGTALPSPPQANHDLHASVMLNPGMSPLQSPLHSPLQFHPALQQHPQATQATQAGVVNGGNNGLRAVKRNSGTGPAPFAHTAPRGAGERALVVLPMLLPVEREPDSDPDPDPDADPNQEGEADEPDWLSLFEMDDLTHKFQHDGKEEEEDGEEQHLSDLSGQPLRRRSAVQPSSASVLGSGGGGGGGGGASESKRRPPSQNGRDPAAAAAAERRASAHTPTPLSAASVSASEEESEAHAHDYGLNRDIVRESIRFDFMTMEADYVKNLEELIEHYAASFREHALKAGVGKDLMSYFPSLHKLHSYILNDVSKSQYISQTFLRYVDYLKMYTGYVVARRQILDVLPTLIKYRKFLELVTRKDKELTMDLGRYLALPVEQLSKYKTLFMRLLPITPQPHPEFASCRRVVAKLDGILRQVADYTHVIQTGVLPKPPHCALTDEQHQFFASLPERFGRRSSSSSSSSSSSPSRKRTASLGSEPLPPLAASAAGGGGGGGGGASAGGAVADDESRLNEYFERLLNTDKSLWSYILSHYVYMCVQSSPTLQTVLLHKGHYKRWLVPLLAFDVQLLQGPGGPPVTATPSPPSARGVPVDPNYKYRRAAMETLRLVLSMLAQLLFHQFANVEDKDGTTRLMLEMLDSLDYVMQYSHDGALLNRRLLQTLLLLISRQRPASDYVALTMTMQHRELQAAARAAAVAASGVSFPDWAKPAAAVGEGHTNAARLPVADPSQCGWKNLFAVCAAIEEFVLFRPVSPTVTRKKPPRLLALHYGYTPLTIVCDDWVVVRQLKQLLASLHAASLTKHLMDDKHAKLARKYEDQAKQLGEYYEALLQFLTAMQHYATSTLTDNLLPLPESSFAALRTYRPGLKTFTARDCIPDPNAHIGLQESLAGILPSV